MTSDLSVVEIVIQRFGGLTALGVALGHENPTTVQGWRERGRIPLTQWPAVERAAGDKGFTDITVTWLALQHAELVRAGAA